MLLIKRYAVLGGKERRHTVCFDKRGRAGGERDTVNESLCLQVSTLAQCSERDAVNESPCLHVCSGQCTRFRHRTQVVHITHMPTHLRNPFANFIRGVEADVLYTLCQNPLFESATTIAYRCGRSRSEVRVVLNFLVATEVVAEFRDGGRKWFHLNRHHPLHEQLLQMGKLFKKMGLRDDLPRTLQTLDAVNE